MNHQPFTIIKHRPALTYERLIGSLGGHAEIWLGLSAITLFNMMIVAIERIKNKIRAKKL